MAALADSPPIPLEPEISMADEKRGMHASASCQTSGEHRVTAVPLTPKPQDEPPPDHEEYEQSLAMATRAINKSLSRLLKRVVGSGAHQPV